MCQFYLQCICNICWVWFHRCSLPTHIKIAILMSLVPCMLWYSCLLPKKPSMICTEAKIGKLPGLCFHQIDLFFSLPICYSMLWSLGAPGELSGLCTRLLNIGTLCPGLWGWSLVMTILFRLKHNIYAQLKTFREDGVRKEEEKQL